MVFYDISASEEFTPSKTQPAHLMDRFFSFLIDYMVISPFVLFLVYLTFKNGLSYWKSNPMAPENDQLLGLVLFSYIFYFSVIQSLFITSWRATPGQYFLKIRLHFHEGQQLGFLRAFFRQLFFWFSFPCLGIPLLAMMTNASRRTFYDRLADVSVVTFKGEKVFFDFENEHRYWQSLMATLVIFATFLGGTLIWKNYAKIVNREMSFAEMEQKKFFCPDLKNVAVTERLQTAIALNLVDQLSDDCLDKEADFVLWRQKRNDLGLAYYAKSLTTTDSEKEKRYLSEACAGENPELFPDVALGCRIAHAFQTNQLDELYLNLHDEVFLADALRYELGKILDKKEDLAENLGRIGKYNSQKNIRKYEISEMLTTESGTERMPASVPSEETADKIRQLLEDL